MIRGTLAVGLGLALIGGCKARDDQPRELEPVQIDPTRPGEPTPSYPGRVDAPGEQRADRMTDERATERPTVSDEEQDLDRSSPDRAEDPVASRQDLQRAIEDADLKIERMRTTGELTESQREDLDNLERRLRELREDLDDAREDSAWEATSDQFRGRVRRINRAIERVEGREA
jgi:hypothetical protein